MAWEHEPMKKEPSNESSWIVEFLSELVGENAALILFIKNSRATYLDMPP